MKTLFLSPNGLDARGVGPRILQFTIPLIIMGIIAHLLHFQWSVFPWKDSDLMHWSGVLLVILGAATFLCAIIHFALKFPSGKLITNGVFGLSRNPIYASWMVMLLPGLSLLLNNWFFMAAAVTMYGAFQYLIVKEEQTLAEVFGKEYEDYRIRVGQIGFIPVIKHYSWGKKFIRFALGSLLTFLALNAFGGGYYGMSGAEGIPIELLDGSPFSTYFLPSLILFVVVGGTSLAAAVAVFAQSRFARTLCYSLIIILSGWLITQVAIIGYVSWMQPATAFIGLLILILTVKY
jgi:protein-S-isoprenylcysteine O-methyltransferase Ste14